MRSPASLDVTSAHPAADSQASDDLRTEVARLHTALADTRAQLARARRMESVGTLAASIADDLNNVLMIYGLVNRRGETCTHRTRR